MEIYERYDGVACAPKIPGARVGLEVIWKSTRVDSIGLVENVSKNRCSKSVHGAAQFYRSLNAKCGKSTEVITVSREENSTDGGIKT